MMKLHWSPRSPYVRKVMVCAHELNLVSRIEQVRTVAAMLQPNERLMRDNPLSKIPTLVQDDGSTLFDSAVICEYLNDLAGGPLFPREGAARWQALRWHALADGLLDALILWRNERERDQPLQAMMDAFEVKTHAAIGLLESEVAALGVAPLSIGVLTIGCALGAVPLSIAHVTIGCALGYLDYRFGALKWRDQAPQLAAWNAQFSERPSMKATIPVDQ